MELWIRSQDKTILLKCENAFLDDLDETEIRTKEFIIGQYKSKERAIEVLDEIQNILEQILDPNITILPIFVYEMPKE